MFSEHGEIVIDRPPDEVFEFVANFENDPEWCPEVESIFRETGEVYAVGTTYKTVVGPKLFREPGGYEIVVSERPSRFEWKLWQGAATGTAAYYLDPAETGTRLRYELHGEISGVQRIMGPFIKYYSNWVRIPRMLKRLKQHLEAGQ